jgi:hypothetical protein
MTKKELIEALEPYDDDDIEVIFYDHQMNSHLKILNIEEVEMITGKKQIVMENAYSHENP